MDTIYFLHSQSNLDTIAEEKTILQFTFDYLNVGRGTSISGTKRLAESVKLHNVIQKGEVYDSWYGKNQETVSAKNRNIVIPRFRAIPFGEELEEEVNIQGGELLNSYKMHRNIANIRNWVHLLRTDSIEESFDETGKKIKVSANLTAEVFGVNDIPYLPDNEYFVKGETNSKKNDWFNSAYANNVESLSHVVGNLSKDQYIGSQEIVIRPFQKFRQLGEAVDRRPVFNERRVFVLDGKVMSEAYYWSSFPEWKDISDASVAPNTLSGEEYQRALQEAIRVTKHLARFYVIDMAEVDSKQRQKDLAENPDAFAWQVVELNDGCMSGISENDPETLWKNVFESLGAVPGKLVEFW